MGQNRESLAQASAEHEGEYHMAFCTPRVSGSTPEAEHPPSRGNAVNSAPRLRAMAHMEIDSIVFFPVSDLAELRKQMLAFIDEGGEQGVPIPEAFARVQARFGDDALRAVMAFYGDHVWK